MAYTITDHFYNLQSKGLINGNWMLNTYDLSIWNIKTGNKLNKMNWTNKNDWKGDFN